jgi:hypothetical protein
MGTLPLSPVQIMFSLKIRAVGGERYLDVRATKVLQNAFVESLEEDTGRNERGRKEVGVQEVWETGQFGILDDKPADPIESLSSIVEH